MEVGGWGGGEAGQSFQTKHTQPTRGHYPGTGQERR